MRTPIRYLFAAAVAAMTAGVTKADIILDLVDIADTTTQVPGGTGTFTTGFSAPTISAGNVAFVGTGSGSQAGVYLASGPGQISTVADTTTAIVNPATTGQLYTNFTSYGAPSVFGSTVSFIASGSNIKGVYGNYGSGLVSVADSVHTIVPGTGSTKYQSFSTTSTSSTAVQITGVFPSNVLGVYSYNTTSKAISTVVDSHSATPIPNGGGGNFTTAGPSYLSGTNYALLGSGGGTPSVYANFGSGSQAVADLNTTIPSGSGLFTSFENLSIWGNQLAFVGIGGTSQGVYATFNSGSSLVKIADENTLAPGIGSDFQFFGSVAMFGPYIAFLGTANSETGLYLYNEFDGSIKKILADGDTYEGKTINSISLSNEAFDVPDNLMTFGLAFSDGSAGVFEDAVVPESSSVLLFSLGIAGCGICYFRRRPKPACRPRLIQSL